MPITFDPYATPTRLIRITLPDTEVTIQDLVDAARNWSDELSNLQHPVVLSAAGKEELAPGVLVGITCTLLNWKIKFADRPSPTWVRCNIRGGNLVALDGNGDSMDPIEPSAYVTVSLTASSSATLTELEAIQFASYQNGVWVSPTNGQSGTAYPIGTREYPVDNFADALTIATNVGLNTLYPMEDVTCSGHNLDGLVIIGENPFLTTVTLSGGCSTEGTEFKDCTLTGIIAGEIEAQNCYLGALTGFKGNARNCGMTGHIKLGAGPSSDLAQFINCYQATAAIGTIQIDMNGDGPALALRAHTGSLEIKNKSGASKVAIDFLSGRVVLASTITAGTFFIRGVGEISENNATGITLHSNPLTNPTTVSDVVWDELRAGHEVGGSMGETMKYLEAFLNNRYEIDATTNIFTIYDTDGVTPLKQWHFYDRDGVLSVTEIFERVPV